VATLKQKKLQRDSFDDLSDLHLCWSIVAVERLAERFEVAGISLEAMKGCRTDTEMYRFPWETADDDDGIMSNGQDVELQLGGKVHDNDEECHVEIGLGFKKSEAFVSLRYAREIEEVDGDAGLYRSVYRITSSRHRLSDIASRSRFHKRLVEDVLRIVPKEMLDRDEGISKAVAERLLRAMISFSVRVSRKLR
jgi:hypothetical protein